MGVNKLRKLFSGDTDKNIIPLLSGSDSFQCSICLASSNYGVMLDNDIVGMERYICNDCASLFGEILGQITVINIGDHPDDLSDALSAIETDFWRGVSSAQRGSFDRLIDQTKKSHSEISKLESEVIRTRQRLESLEAQADAEAQRKDGEGYVYLMLRNNGDHKIGLSGNPDRRLTQIRRKFPDTELVYTIKVDDMRQAESILHDEFAAKRQDGEWFTLTDKDVASIQQRVRFEDGWFLERQNTITKTETNDA